jgi:hypothetical protein
MASKVQVQFSASIKNLIDATNQVKTAIDEVAEQAEAANAMLSKFGEFAGISLGVEGIKRFVESMAELGEHTEDMAAQLGMSTTSIQELGYLAKMTGGDADSMALAFERLQANLQRAQNPTSQQAQALRALGLSARELIGVPLDQQMAKLADAFSHFADGGNKTAAAMMLFGRAGARMIPLLDQGSQGLQTMADNSENTAAIMSAQTIKALADLNKSLIGAKASLVGMSGTLVGIFAPDLADATNKLNEFVSTLAIMIETGNVWEYVSTDIGTRLEVLGLKTVRLVKAMEDLRNMHPLEAWKDLSIGQQAIDGLQKKINGDLAPVIAKAREQLKALLAPPPPPPGGGKPQVPPTNVNRGAENSARIAGLNNEMQYEEKAYQQTVAHLNAEAKIGIITEQQKVQQQLAAVNQREKAEEWLLGREKAIGGLSAEQYQEIENKKTQSKQKAAADRQKIEDKSNEDISASAKRAADSIASAFNSQLSKLLAGQETWSQAMKGMFSSMIEAMISKLVTLIAEYALLNAVAAATGASPVSFMSLIMPSHAAGAWNLGSNEVAQLHKNEMVIPAKPAESIRSAMGGGHTDRFSDMARAFAGGNSTDARQLNANFVYNGGSFLSPETVRQHIRTIASELNAHWAGNPSTRPTY